MSTISVRTHFAAGHRILGLTGEGAKCRNIHGHTFTVTWVFQQSASLEFGTLKAALRGLVKYHFDHGFVLDKTDDFCDYLRVNRLKAYPLDGPPTTEAMAAEIARLSIQCLTVPWDSYSQKARTQDLNDHTKALYPNAQLLKVILDEGPENSATCEVGTEVTKSGTEQKPGLTVAPPFGPNGPIVPIGPIGPGILPMPGLYGGQVQ